MSTVNLTQDAWRLISVVIKEGLAYYTALNQDGTEVTDRIVEYTELDLGGEFKRRTPEDDWLELELSQK